MSTKTRTEMTNSCIFVERAYYGSTQVSESIIRRKNLSYQSTSSLGHKWPLPPGSNLDSGGSFVTSKIECIGEPVNVSSTNGPKTSGVWYRADGPVYARYSNFNSISVPSPSANATLDAWGTTAIARVLPTNPLSGMGQFLGELREIPRLFNVFKWKKFVSDIRKNAADDYLNLQFGWIPFVSDLLSFTRVVENSESIIKHYDRNSGRNVRRKYGPEIVSQTTSVAPTTTYYGSPTTVATLVDTPGKLSESSESSTIRSFSGAFTYYLPPSGLNSRSARAAALRSKLFGTRITPELVWQLAPWSWAVDWVSNVGDIVHNWSAFQNDGLVMRYGYVMETKSTKTSYALNNLSLKGHGNVSSTQVVTSVTKSRRRATPYGFGLKESGFSARQWSIIAALGFSKKPRSLN